MPFGQWDQYTEVTPSKDVADYGTPCSHYKMHVSHFVNTAFFPIVHHWLVDMLSQNRINAKKMALDYGYICALVANWGNTSTSGSPNGSTEGHIPTMPAIIKWHGIKNNNFSQSRTSSDEHRGSREKAIIKNENSHFHTQMFTSFFLKIHTISSD